MNTLHLVSEVDLIGSDDDYLRRISEDMGLGLSVGELKIIEDYFKKRGRNPTDIELQSLAQAWSEHCCYKSSKTLLKRYILIDVPQNILMGEDAGILEFNDEYAYAVAFESHNHPSNIEPYGGAATGIGGIVRDVVCMGATPVALIDPLFFDPLKGIKSKFLLNGVVSGISDYGNRIGVPTISGMVYFDEDYVSNCLVNVGCVGIVKKSEIIRSRAKEGDLFILVGGRTGRDGIHGVTFASAELSEKSEEDRGAVQLGDPITKEPLIHACLEANERGLLDGMKDLGGGGLSCVIGEMALAGGCGAEIELENVPLKEEGLKPWEILVSESQERMMLSVDPKNLKEVLGIFEGWDLLATVIGKATKERFLKIKYNNEEIYEIDLNFLVDGVRYNRIYEIKNKEEKIERFNEPRNYEETFSSILSSPNIASKESIIRRYDHEVGGRTVLKPLQGEIGFSSHGDASVIKPLEDSYKGLAITSDINPSFMKINPYKGSLSAVDEVCRNLVSVGSLPHSLADCLNFGNPEKPLVMGYFHESVRALGEIARELGLPYSSGNVSFYNETPEGSIPPTPVILGVGIIEDIRRSITSDIKGRNPIYLIGETREELGGSEYLKIIGVSGVVPDVNIKVLKRSIEAILKEMARGNIASCHDISEGGIAVCLAEMCLGGNIGANIDLSLMGEMIANRRFANLKISDFQMRSDIKLFSESNTRWIVEVNKKREEEFVEDLKDQGLGCTYLGKAGGDGIRISDKKKGLINIPLDKIRDIWGKGLEKFLR